MAPERTAVPFFENLRTSGLLSDAQLAELAKCPEARDPAPTPLARVVFQRGWLTRFQLNTIAAGRGKELVVGPYILLDRLGEGGMGMVYKAQQKHLERVVALKVIRKEKLASADAVKRFYREMEMAATVHHPNIVLAYDAGQEGNTHYFSMEFVDGVDLARLVKEQGKLPVPLACDYVRQAALGLQHAHEKGLVHRDVKPGNLLLGPAPEGQAGGVVKLLDMGLARLQGAGDPGLTRLGAVLGSPDYVAPEQAMNSRAADIRADLYSLGCTLHFLLTGQPPFSAVQLTEVLLKHQMEKPRPLAVRGVEAPAGVQAILDKLMAKHPDDRYQTPAELVKDLTPFCGTGKRSADAVQVRAVAEPVDDWAALSLERSADGLPTAGLSRSSAGVRAKPRPKDQEAARRKYLLLMAGGGVAGFVVLGLVLYLVFGGPNPDPVAQRPRPTEPAKKGPTAPLDSSKQRQPVERGGKPVQPPHGAVGFGTLPMLVVSTRSGKADIFLVNADGSEAKSLTDGNGTNSYPAWSHDGRKIAFVSDRDGPRNIYVMDADGTHVQQLTRGTELSRVPSWSPDGKKITFCRDTAEGVRIFIMDAHGSNVTAVGAGDGYDPAWSPDGKKILFTSLRSGGGFRVFVMDVDGLNVKELSSNDNPFGFVYPAWSPDGKKIAWTARAATGLEIFAADAGGQNAKQLTKLGGTNTYAAWSPDGKKIAFHHYENNESGVYYVMDADGEDQKAFLKDEPPVEGGRPVWRPK